MRIMDADAAHLLYRAMKREVDDPANPLVEQSARGLGVRSPDDVQMASSQMFSLMTRA